jgi:hypothetical protein
MRLQLFESDELERGCVRRLKIDRGRATVIKRRFPAGDADAPFVARFQSGKAPFRNRGDKVVPVEHGKIEELARYLDANGVLADVFGTGAAKTVTIESGHGVAAATAKLSAENVGRHGIVELLKRYIVNRESEIRKITVP